MYVYMCDVCVHVRKWAYMAGVESVPVWMSGVRVCIWPSAGGQAWDQVQKEASLKASACPRPTQPPTPTMKTDFLEAAIMQGCSQQPGCLPPPLRTVPAGAGVPPPPPSLTQD